MEIAIGEVQIGKRLRHLRESAVVGLMDSIQHLGLQTPITISSRPAKREGGGMDTVAFDLVAGQHRIEACKRLGWEKIEAEIVQMSEDERVLWEIDENLCRADLTELERGEHLAKRKPVYERLYPQSKAGQAQAAGMNRALGRDVGDENSPTFTEDSAAKIGKSQRTVQKAIHRATGIDEKVRDRIRDIPEIADSTVELDALVDLKTADQQRRAVALVESGQAAGIRDAKKLMEPPKPPKLQPHFKEAEIARQKRRDAFTRAWNALDEEDREWARAQIDTPVADSAPALRAV